MLPLKRTNAITFVWFRYLFPICQKILAGVSESTFNYTICLLTSSPYIEQAVDRGTTLLRSVFLSSQCVYVCLCMFTRVVSVLFVKLQVCDLKHSRAAVLLSLSHRARVREPALYCKCVPWRPGTPGDCYPGVETSQRTPRRPCYLNPKKAACYKWATDTNKLNNLPKFLLRRFS